jgi:hypothetical protein
VVGALVVADGTPPAEVPDELRRHLRPGGRVIVGVSPWWI